MVAKGSGKGRCRFGYACTRPGCWFEHPPDHVLDQENAKPDPVPCRFGAACHRADCRYSHPAGHDPSAPQPVDCLYGNRCTRPGCTFAHPQGHVLPEQEASLKDDEPEDAPEHRVCVWFQKGKCTNGSACKFQHVRQERDGNVIVVRDLPRSADPEELQREILEYFRTFGYVARILVKTDLDNRCRGFAFVIMCDTRAVDEALQSKHPTWDVKRKTDLPMFVEGDDRSTRKTSAPTRGPIDAPLRLPFSMRDKVLLVGEGDFSFTAAAVKLGLLNPSSTVATALEAPRDEEHVRSLRSRGVDCRTGVDATVLSLRHEDRFSVVVFNFPHTGQPSIEANIRLLQGFFRCVQSVLRVGGRVAVTMKQTWPYNEWGVDQCASSEGFQVLATYPFPASVLCDAGYTHVTTDRIPHQVGFLDTAKTIEYELRS